MPCHRVVRVKLHRVAPAFIFLSLCGGALAPPSLAQSAEPFAGNPEVATGQLELALAVCRDPDPGPAGPALSRIAPLLEAAKRLIHEEQGGVARPALQCLVIAIAIAATEVPQPR